LIFRSILPCTGTILLKFREVRKTEEDLKATATKWNQMLLEAADNLPDFLHFED